MTTLNSIDTFTLIWILLTLIAMSAFFSSSETAMMSINKYKLKALAKQGHSGAKKTYFMLKHVDKLLGIILIGNTLVNFIATTFFTIIGFRLLGETGIAIAPFLATIFFLIFAEVSPKTIAAHYPEKIALTNSHILQPLMKFFSPLIFVVNSICNLLLKPFRIDVTQFLQQDINLEELRLLVSHNLVLSNKRQAMLLSIMDLGSQRVNDLMIPLSDIMGINIEDDIEIILQSLTNSEIHPTTGLQRKQKQYTRSHSLKKCYQSSQVRHHLKRTHTTGNQIPPTSSL